MNTRTGSTLKTVLEYLGRGATPADGYYWFRGHARIQTAAPEELAFRQPRPAQEEKS